MGDMREDFELLKAMKKERHAKWKNDNLKYLTENMAYRYTLKNNEESALFREHGYPKVDFYPSTGRWRVAGRSKTYSGGAESFHKWYETQKEK